LAGSGANVASLQNPDFEYRPSQAQPERPVRELSPVADRDEVNRSIGAAAGIVMMQRHISYAEALSFLQHLSRQNGRALHQVAQDVTETSEALADRSISSQDQGWARAQASTKLITEWSVDDLIAGRLLDLLVERKDVGDVLYEMTQLGVDIVVGCESASITLIHDGVAATVASSDSSARSLDEIQYADGDGPCLQAARTDRMIRVDDLADGPPQERPWREAALGRGVTASLSLPVPAGREVRAALNLYTVQPGGWTPQSLNAAQALVMYTGDAIALSLRDNDPDDLLDPPGRGPAGGARNRSRVTGPSGCARCLCTSRRGCAELMATQTPLPAKHSRSALAGPYGHPFHPILVTISDPGSAFSLSISSPRAAIVQRRWPKDLSAARGRALLDRADTVPGQCVPRQHDPQRSAAGPVGRQAARHRRQQAAHHPTSMDGRKRLDSEFLVSLAQLVFLSGRRAGSDEPMPLQPPPGGRGGDDGYRAVQPFSSHPVEGVTVQVAGQRR
jgi:hypothetical protein